MSAKIRGDRAGASRPRSSPAAPSATAAAASPRVNMGSRAFTRPIRSPDYGGRDRRGSVSSVSSWPVNFTIHMHMHTKTNTHTHTLGYTNTHTG
jgi:hypothetical protein